MANRFWRDDVIQGALDREVDAAVAEQQAILAKDPNNANAYFALGTLRHFQGQTDQAIGYFEKAVAINPRYAAPHVSLGQIYAVQGDHDRAWQHARAAERNGDRSVVELLERYSNLR